jgi:hypothetical protein
MVKYTNESEIDHFDGSIKIYKFEKKSYNSLSEWATKSTKK